MWDVWATGYIATIDIKSEKDYTIRVDALPFLYEMTSALVDLFENGLFLIDIGEGFWLRGICTDNGIDVTVAFEAGGRNNVLLVRHVSFDDALMLIIVKIGELVKCLELIGLNPESYLSRFPMSGYKREF